WARRGRRAPQEAERRVGRCGKRTWEVVSETWEAAALIEFQIHAGGLGAERDGEGAGIDLELARGAVGADAVEPRRLFDAQAGDGCDGVFRGQREAHRTGLPVELH